MNRGRWTTSTLWCNRNFLRLWTAKTVSDFGSLVSRAALSFTAVLLLKATPAQLSLLMIADLLPKFLIGLVAGVWVDRLPRRPVMMFADVGRALLLCAIPVAALFGALRIELLYIVTLLCGMLSLLFDIADRSFLPAVVEDRHLPEANSKLTATASVAEFSAFALAGWLVQWFTGPIAVLLDALSFLCSALFLGGVRVAEPPPPPPAEREGFFAEAREGMTTIRQNATLAALAVCTALMGVAGGLLGTAMVAFMARDLGFAPGLLGMVWAIGGVTSLLGAASAGTITRWTGLGRSLVLGLIAASAGVLVTALAQGKGALALACLIANQIICDPGYTLFHINQVSLRQTIVAERLQGRVNATFEFVSLGATLFGAVLCGQLGDKLGLRTMIVLGGGLLFLAALWLQCSPVRRVKSTLEAL